MVGAPAPRFAKEAGWGKGKWKMKHNAAIATAVSRVTFSLQPVDHPWWGDKLHTWSLFEEIKAGLHGYHHIGEWVRISTSLMCCCLTDKISTVKPSIGVEPYQQLLLNNGLVLDSCSTAANKSNNNKIKWCRKPRRTDRVTGHLMNLLSKERLIDCCWSDRQGNIQHPKYILKSCLSSLIHEVRSEIRGAAEFLASWTRENCIVTEDASGLPCNISPASGEDRHTATDTGSSEATK